MDAVLCGERVGVEIETNLKCDQWEFVNKYTNRDEQWVSPRGLFFQVKSDSSLGIKNARGTEIVSPILGEADLPELGALVRFLPKVGAYTTDVCGLHVHVDRVLNGRPVNTAKLKKLFDEEITLIKAGKPSAFGGGPWVLPYKVRSHGCSEIKDQYGRITRYARKGYCKTDFDQVHDVYDRYQAIARGCGHDTYEYRLFNCVLNTRYVMKCIHWACRLTSSART